MRYCWIDQRLISLSAPHNNLDLSLIRMLSELCKDVLTIIRAEKVLSSCETVDDSDSENLC